LRADLAAIGADHCLPDTAAIAAVELELVYGHCWGGGARPPGGEIRIDVGRIGGRGA
jgi:hypothetical protein